MQSIEPNVRIAHAQLKVGDVELAIGFYRGSLGFGLTQRYRQDAAFVADDTTSRRIPP